MMETQEAEPVERCDWCKKLFRRYLRWQPGMLCPICEARQLTWGEKQGVEPPRTAALTAARYAKLTGVSRPVALAFVERLEEPHPPRYTPSDTWVEEP